MRCSMLAVIAVIQIGVHAMEQDVAFLQSRIERGARRYKAGAIVGYAMVPVAMGVAAIGIDAYEAVYTIPVFAVGGVTSFTLNNTGMWACSGSLRRASAMMPDDEELGRARSRAGMMHLLGGLPALGAATSFTFAPIVALIGEYWYGLPLWAGGTGLLVVRDLIWSKNVRECRAVFEKRVSDKLSDTDESSRSITLSLHPLVGTRGQLGGSLCLGF